MGSSERRTVATVIAAAVYAVLCGSLFTGLYHPFYIGRDDSWVTLVVLAGAHLGLGFAVTRCLAFVAVLLLGLLVVAVWVAAGGDAAAPYFAFALLVMCGLLVGVGRVMRRAYDLRHPSGPARGRLLIVVALYGLAAVPFTAAAAETVKRGFAPHVPAAQARLLPVHQHSLNGLCSMRHVKASRPQLRSQVDALKVAFRRDPDAIVRTSYTPAEQPGIRHEDMTVRELVEDQLGSLLDSEDQGFACPPDVIHRLRHLLADG